MGLRREPLCRRCLKAGIKTPATDRDHIVPKRAGGRDADSNLQSLCKACHNHKTAQEVKQYGAA